MQSQTDIPLFCCRHVGSSLPGQRSVLQWFRGRCPHFCQISPRLSQRPTGNSRSAGLLPDFEVIQRVEIAERPVKRAFRGVCPPLVAPGRERWQNKSSAAFKSRSCEIASASSSPGSMATGATRSSRRRDRCGKTPAAFPSLLRRHPLGGVGFAGFGC